MLGDGELAEVLHDRVVRFLGGRAGRPVDGVRVDARADGGLAAGGREGRGLALDEALDGALGGQGLAVVDPRGAGRGDRQGCGRDLDFRRGFQGGGLTPPDGHIDLDLNRVSACIFVFGRSFAPRCTAIGTVLNRALFDEVLSLLPVLLGKVASFINGNISRLKSVLLAIISTGITSHSKACPQRIKGVGLVVAVNIGNGVAGFPDGGRLTSAFLVKPANERFTRGGRPRISYLNGVVLAETIAVVPLLISHRNGIFGGSPCRA